MITGSGGVMSLICCTGNMHTLYIPVRRDKSAQLGRLRQCSSRCYVDCACSGWKSRGSGRLDHAKEIQLGLHLMASLRYRFQLYKESTSNYRIRSLYNKSKASLHIIMNGWPSESWNTQSNRKKGYYLLLACQFLETRGNRDLLLHPGANTSVFALRKLAAAFDSARQNLLRQE